MSLLFLGKQNDVFGEKAREFLEAQFPPVTTYLAQRGEPRPESLCAWEGDYLVSYLSPWVAPEAVLERARQAAINFHPGPPEYPGIGCTNFALYEGATEFGVTCHHMAPQVDSGAIIAVRRFPIFPNDTVWSLTQRCYAHILSLFFEIMSEVALDKPLPTSEETWRRKPFRRRELNALCRLTPEMPEAEIRRRIRAVTYPGAPGAYLELAGQRFVLDSQGESRP